MTESDWLTATDQHEMLAFLRDGGQLTDRKGRLFAAACCRRAWHFLDARRRRAVEVAEGYADGLVRKYDFHCWNWLRQGPCGTACLFVGADAAVSTADATEGLLFHTTMALDGPWRALWDEALDAARERGLSTVEAIAAADAALMAVPSGVAWLDRREALRGQVREAQATLLRDIFGNPFAGPPRIDPAWLAWNDGTIPRLAEAAYQERALPSGELDRQLLAVLADALEEAGCNEEALLGHLRGPGPCVRGCHVVDLLTGREASP